MNRKTWSVNSLSEELRISRQAITKALQDITPVETRSLGNRTERRYYLSDVVEALVEGKTGSGSPATEKARLDRLRADQIEFDLAIKREQYAPIEIFEFALADISSQQRSILGGIPKRVKNSLPALRAREIKIIEREIIKARNAISEIQVDFNIEGDGK